MCSELELLCKRLGPFKLNELKFNGTLTRMSKFHMKDAIVSMILFNCQFRMEREIVSEIKEAEQALEVLSERKPSDKIDKLIRFEKSQF